MKNPRTALADARIRLAAARRAVAIAERDEFAAELALKIAERAEVADTVRPPPNTTIDLDGGWS